MQHSTTTQQCSTAVQHSTTTQQCSTAQQRNSAAPHSNPLGDHRESGPSSRYRWLKPFRISDEIAGRLTNRARQPAPIGVPTPPLLAVLTGCRNSRTAVTDCAELASCGRRRPRVAIAGSTPWLYLEGAASSCRNSRTARNDSDQLGLDPVVIHVSQPLLESLPWCQPLLESLSWCQSSG